MSNITLHGDIMHTVGELPALGTQAPDFTFTNIDLAEIKFKNYFGQPIVLNIFPSLDTSTCATAMVRFNEIARGQKGVLFLCISMDLPFAQKRFCSAQHLANVQPVSVFRHPQFGQTYGVAIADGPLKGLLSRAVVVLDEEGKITYTEQVPELSSEPNYAALIAKLN